jgi:hypothetical protein
MKVTITYFCDLSKSHYGPEPVAKNPELPRKNVAIMHGRGSGAWHKVCIFKFIPHLELIKMNPAKEAIMQNKPYSQNRWKQGNTSQGLNDRGADYQSMGWDKSGRDYHSSNYGQNASPNLNSNYRRQNNDQYLGSMHSAPPQNLGRARDDAEYAFNNSSRNFSNSQNQGQSQDARRHEGDSRHFGHDHEDNYSTYNTGYGPIGQSAYRNREDVLGIRGDNDTYAAATHYGYGRDNFDSTRYGESDRGFGGYDTERSLQSRYSTESDRIGSHFGKGPKGYKRSDSRIQEDAHEALTRDHDIDASEIEVSVKDGVITLSGAVPERKMKRLAEDCVETISGVIDVRNEISAASLLSSLFGNNTSKSEGKVSGTNRKNTSSSSNTDMM